ncbi:hypothetical protein AAHC03_024542 [Spirometra sp. Aus1]
MQCLQHEDTCMTNISYTVPPYWTPHGDRAHFLWKSCTTAAICQQAKEIAAKDCMREWYMDWRCVECCQGELCNYYVTLDGTRLDVFSGLLLPCLIVNLLSHLFV